VLSRPKIPSSKGFAFLWLELQVEGVQASEAKIESPTALRRPDQQNDAFEFDSLCRVFQDKDASSDTAVICWSPDSTIWANSRVGSIFAAKLNGFAFDSRYAWIPNLFIFVTFAGVAALHLQFLCALLTAILEEVEIKGRVPKWLDNRWSLIMVPAAVIDFSSFLSNGLSHCAASDSFDCIPGGWNPRGRV
jgi:hypothetical protein